MNRYATTCLTLSAAVFPMVGITVPTESKNVLLLCVDDLRPVAGCYGGAAKTPNLDRLAETAAVFTRHYIQWPVCGPSRASMLGGRRPDTTGIYEISNSWKISQEPDSCPTLPLWFKEHGYRTLSFGKTYHSDGKGLGFGWSDDPWHPESGWTCYVNFHRTDGTEKTVDPCYEIYDGPDSLHNDYQTADQVIAALKENKDRPFFIAGGFYKPHLPFVAPKKYWDLYSEDDIRRLDPEGLPAGAADYMYYWSELSNYTDPEENLYTPERLPVEQEALKMIHAYYACVSFNDAQIGRVLDALNELELSSNTAVVVWGDHGFHLGDHNRWAKHTQFEQAMRSPLIVRLPGEQKIFGETRAIAESVDIYPTLCEYAGLPVPDFTDGKSLLPLLAGTGSGKESAFSQIHPVDRAHSRLMAYSVRTKDFRYVEWRDTENQYQQVWTELYDHRTDPEETVSVADRSEYAQVIKTHTDLVRTNYKTLMGVVR